MCSRPMPPVARMTRLGGHHHVPLIIEIFKDRAGTVPLVVAEQFNGGRKLEQLNLLIDDLVLQHAHDLEAGIVGAGQKTRLGTAAALLHMEIAVGLPIEQHTQFQAATSQSTALPRPSL